MANLSWASCWTGDRATTAHRGTVGEGWFLRENVGTTTRKRGMMLGKVQSSTMASFSWVKEKQHFQRLPPLPEFHPGRRRSAGGMAALRHHSIPNAVNLYFSSSQQSTWRSLNTLTFHRGREPWTETRPRVTRCYMWAQESWTISCQPSKRKVMAVG